MMMMMMMMMMMIFTWWRHQMEIFSALLALCAGNSPMTGELPAQRPVTRSFDVFFDLHLNKRLSKQLWGWWFETPSHSLWRHCNERFPTQFPKNLIRQYTWLGGYSNKVLWMVLTLVYCTDRYFLLISAEAWPWVKVTDRSSSAFPQTCIFLVPNTCVYC